MDFVLFNTGVIITGSHEVNQLINGYLSCTSVCGIIIV
jgi:hypothetical protein